MAIPLRDFLEIPYDKLEEMNLAAKADRLGGKSPDTIREARMKYLTDEKRIKAVTVCFTDLEGRFHMLDYDKKFLLGAADNLTFDGSSIRGFSAAGRVGPAPGHRLARLLLAAGGRLRPRQGARLRRGAGPGRLALRRRHARPPEGLLRRAQAAKGLTLQRRQRDRGLPVQGPRRGAPLPRDGALRVHLHRRLLPLPARAIRCGPSSTRRPRSSGPWASATRRTTPRWPPPSSR